MDIFVAPTESGDYVVLNESGLLGEAKYDEERSIYVVWLTLSGFIQGEALTVSPCDDRWKVDPAAGVEMVDDENATYGNVEDAVRAGVVALLKARF